MAAAPDREKALDLALAQIDKQFGKGSVMRLGERPAVPMAVIPTGSIALDVALGVGGLPRGRVVEIYGPESSGKCLTADTYLLTDRGLETVREPLVRFPKWDAEVSGEFCQLMKQLFDGEVRDYHGKDLAVHGVAFRRRMAEEYGLDYVTAHGKTVPHRVRTGGHKAQRAFLSALFEGDGWIDPTSTVGLGTASEQLAPEVQLMLYRL